MADETLYIGSNGHVCAFRVSDGREAWRTKLGGGVLSATTAQDVCVLHHGGRILAGCRGHLFCLDAATGHVLWQNELKGLGYNDVTLAMAGKSIQYVSSDSHHRS